jgi:hypothetical protein
MHVDEPDEVASAAQQQLWQNLDVLVISWLLLYSYFCGGRTYILVTNS